MRAQTLTMPDDLDDLARDGRGAAATTARTSATGDATFVSTQPLIANPLLPQFARPGDRFDLGVSIANQTGAGGALDLVLQLTGALAFAQGDPRAQRPAEQAATGVQAFRFPVVVGTPAPTTLEAQATLGAHGDAFSGSVHRARARQHRLGDRERSDARRGLDSDRADDSGGTLQVTLANSVVPQFVTPSQRVISGDSLPLADDVGVAARHRAARCGACANRIVSSLPSIRSAVASRQSLTESAFVPAR